MTLSKPPMPSSERARRPAHAGSFYPADPGRLEHIVDGLLREAAEAQVSAPAGTPLGLLVPHAGIEFSGSVAARGWVLLGERTPSSVVLAGTNHFADWFAGVGVWTGGPWSTPLGAVSADCELGSRVVSLGPPFASAIDAHLEEHSIEVQLPLLARACPEARIVPLLVSMRYPSACRTAGRMLGRLLRERCAVGERIALVASSDLAHYPTESRAHEVDQQVLGPILALDAWDLARREEKLRAARIPGLACGLCGLEPVLFTLAALREMGATRGMLLAHATSADVPGGDPDRVVGYAAVAFVA